MKIIYRISDSGYPKSKPTYINNENCLKNFCNIFFDNINDIDIIADNCSDDTLKMISNYINPINIEKVSIGHGAGTFNLALDKALKYSDDEIVYFVENDYLHQPGSPKIIKEGIRLGASFVSLYDHPDKYLPPHQGGNPEVDFDGGYMTKLYRGETEVFALHNSTTMTFATTIKTLKQTEYILRKHTQGTYPDDFKMFLELRNNGYYLLCPINSYSTHGETQWLGVLPGVVKENIEKEWGKICNH
jgi:hypothetical protein